MKFLGAGDILKVAVLLVSPLSASTPYLYAPFDYPGAVLGGPGGINSSGTIAGGWNDGSRWHGYLWSGGTFATLDRPGFDHTSTARMNNAGDLVGATQNEGQPQVGFLYSGGTFTTIHYPGSYGGGAGGINATGLIVGTYYDSNYSPKAYKLSGGTYTDISPPGSVQSAALDINDAGDIVGWFKNVYGNNERGYLLRSGIYTAIEVPGALRTFPVGNNNAGMIVGFYEDAGGVFRGFTLSPGGVFETIMYPGSTDTNVADISDSGVLVGSYNRHGFIATPGYQVCQLYDSTKAVKSGATIPIKIQLCDENGANLSSASTVLHVTGVVRVSTNASVEIQDPGNANPDSDFRFDPTLGGAGGGYVFNFKTTGLAAGTYRLSFTAGTGPATYSTDFQVR